MGSMMSVCLDQDRFVALRDGCASQEEEQQAAQHLLSCATCAARWADLGRNAATLGSQDEGPVLAAPAAVPIEGRLIEGYRVLREVGRGARGAVYEAVQEDTGLRAAVKVLFPEYRQQPRMGRRFRAEGRAPALVRHPGLVTVFNYGQLLDGTAYILMEYLEGPSLRERLAAASGGRLPLMQALRICRQIASALAAIHRHGIVHRDLKPANVMIVTDEDVASGERAIVVDFGIAKFNLALTQDSQAGLQATGDNTFVGTAAYASPEQCRLGGALDGKADVYALGVMLYKMLAGAVPFDGPTAEVIELHQHGAPPPLRERVEGVPPAVHALVHGMLAKEPAQRPSAEQVRERLDRLLPEAREQGGIPVAWLLGAGLGLLLAGAALLHFLRTSA